MKTTITDLPARPMIVWPLSVWQQHYEEKRDALQRLQRARTKISRVARSAKIKARKQKGRR